MEGGREGRTYLEHLAFVAIERVDTPTASGGAGIPKLDCAVFAAGGDEGFVGVPLCGFNVPGEEGREGGREGGTEG